jgi:hypothetical protein
MTDDDTAPATAAESLRLIETQRAATHRSLVPDPRLIYWPWGISWFVGFGLLYLRFGPSQKITVDMPSWLPETALFVLMGIALIVSSVAGARSNRQISGDSSRKGLRYGLSWFLAFAMFAPLAARLSDRLPEAESGLLWAAGSVGIVATLYLAGSAIWLDRNMFVLGLWLAVMNVAGVIAGPGWHSLVICIGGGLGMIVAGLAEYLRVRPLLSGRPAT